MTGLYIPIMILVASNTIYHICAKSTPTGVNTFASLSVTYVIAAIATLVLFFLTKKETSLLAEYRQLNWTSFALGLAIIGLEAGNLLMYKMGWNISAGQVVHSAFLAVVLIIVGRILYREPITLQKVLGAAICLTGLYIINK